MKKILSSLLAMTMLLTTLSASVIPARAEDAAEIGAFTENFENYGSGNWLANMAADGKTVGTAISGMSANQWTIYAGQSTTAKTVAEIVADGASMEVVTDPADANNKVLKLDSGNLASGGWFFFRRNANEGQKINRTDLPAKKMVVKAKFRLPKNYKSTSDTTMLAYNSQDSAPRQYISDQVGGNYSSTKWTILASGSKTYGANNNVKVQDTVPTEQWFEFKQVMDFTGNKTADHPADTYRGFLNGTIYTMRYPQYTGSTVNEINSLYPQPSTTIGEYGDKMVDSMGGYKVPASNSVYQNYGDYYGVAMILSSAATDYDYMYMDDLEVYYVDAFAREGEVTIEKTKNGAWYAGEIRIPFNNELNANVKEKFETTLNDYTVSGGNYEKLFTLKDAEGNVVEGGIADAYVDGNVLAITPAKTIERNKAYTISASPLFMDVDGQGLNSYSKDQAIFTFNTAEDPFAHVIYDFDFEDTKIDGTNWIESTDGTKTSDNRYVIADGIKYGAVTITKSASASADHSIKVENDPTGADNKVLALKAGYEGEGYVTQIRFNANEKTGLSRSTDMGKGKNLVYKTRIFIPSGFSMTESAQLVNGAKETQALANDTSGIGATMSGPFYVATTGKWGTPMARHKVTAAGKWLEWKHVADVSEPLSDTHSDTVRAYVDDIMFTTEFIKSNAASEGKVFGDNAKYDHNLYIGAQPIIDYLTGGKDIFTTTPYVSLGATWWGSQFTINPKVGTGTHVDTFYLDDVEAFWIDDLTFDAVNATNFEGGKVKLNFNQKIRKEVQYIAGQNSSDFNGMKKLALADLFKIVDPATKAEIPGGIATVALSADEKAVSITPSAELEKGGDYQIEISPYLIDEYGQGLLNNSLPTYVDLHVSETFTPFEMTSISQTEFSGYTQGRAVKVTAKFSVAVDDESITDGIVVTNSKGEVIARNNGWTANFGTDKDGNTDYQTIVFDFGSLPTDDYTVAINEYFVATNGAELASAFGIKINKATERIVLFEDDFEDYAEENWLSDKYAVTDGTLTDSTTYKSYTVNDHEWDIQTHWKGGTYNPDNETDFAGVVTATDSMKGTAMSGNVFKLVSTRSGSYSDNYVAFRRNFNKLEGLNFSSEEYKGKKLVYEADIYADKVAGDNSFFVPFAASYTKNVRDYNDWKMLFSGGALRSPGHYEYNFNEGGPLTMFSQIIPAAKITAAPVNYRIVISMGENVDTLAYFSNGELVQREPGQQAVLVGHEWNNSARHEFGPSDGTFGETVEINDIIYGVWGLASQGKSVIYIDNFKAYLVDEFKIESVEGAGDVFNTAKSDVTFTFSKPVNAMTATANAGVVLLNEAGEEVAGGIESVTLSDADYKITVKLSKSLPGSTKYRIKINETLTDVDGLPVSTEWKYFEYPIDDYYSLLYGAGDIYSVTDTSKSIALDMKYIPATNSKPAYLTYEYYNAKGVLQTRKAAVDTYVRDADAMKMYADITTTKAVSLYATATPATVNGAEVSTSVVFTNPEESPRSVWCVVAAYGEYGKMIGYTTIDIAEVPASSSTEEIQLNFTARNNKIKTVKMFVWDNNDNMNPYHKSEAIWSE